MTSATRNTINVHPELLAQREYTHHLRTEGFDFALVAAEAFVRGIRDIGYKSSGTALDELIDNSIQAGAKNVHVILGYGVGSDAKPDRVAVLDDGHGMDPDMIRTAVLWGGTHREGDRKGFGRYGYGLPSACVSQGRKFTVFSLPVGGQLHAVSLDVDDLGAGKYHVNGRVTVPEPQPAMISPWVQQYMREHTSDKELKAGTLVTIEKVDRLVPKTTDALERNLLEHFGITYRNFLREVMIYVNGKKVHPVDPLFTTEGYRFHDLDEDRAKALEPLLIEVKGQDNGQVPGSIRVRFAHYPPTFASKDKTKDAEGKNANPRFSIMKDHNGIIVLRAGRQIDVITRCPWTTFQNYDRYWKVEIDFSPTLDEEFSIATSKQQVVLSDRIWEVLRQAGVYKAIEQLRKNFRDANATRQAERDRERGEQRSSEQVMQEAEKFKSKPSAGDPVQRQAEAQKRLEEEVLKRTNESHRPPEQIKQELLAEVQGRPFKVTALSSPGAPFFRTEQIGGQRVLYLNSAHRFFTDLYAGPEATPRSRAGLELLLFVIGDSELDASDDRRLFYQTERQLWSEKFNTVLDLLNRLSNVDDHRASEEELRSQSTA